MTTITDHIKHPGVFCPEEISAMSDAYDFILGSFSKAPGNRAREIIAARIIAVASSAESDPQTLCERALSAFGMKHRQREIPIPDVIAAPACRTCNSAMRLFGIETDESGRELLSFECSGCEQVETTTDRYPGRELH
jgi:hypothetical protein